MAFPSTGILDNFNRGDEGPPPSANWGTGSLGDVGLAVSGNVCDIHSSDGRVVVGSGYWSAATFGPDCEAYCTITTMPIMAEFHLVARLLNPDSGSNRTGYYALFGSEGAVTFYRIDGLTDSAIGTQVMISLAVGDSIGFAIVGTILKAYHKPAAGAWTLVLSCSDATYREAGYIGANIFRVLAPPPSPQFDDFGGGLSEGMIHLYAVDYAHEKMSGDVEYLPGDRAAYSVEDYHAADIEATTPTRHNPLPGAAGHVPRSDSAKWVSAFLDFDDLAGDCDLADLADYARGSVIRGGASDWEAHDAKTAGDVLIGDGTDILSQAISGDATLAADGTVRVVASPNLLAFSWMGF